MNSVPCNNKKKRFQTQQWGFHVWHPPTNNVERQSLTTILFYCFGGFGPAGFTGRSTDPTLAIQRSRRENIFQREVKFSLSLCAHLAAVTLYRLTAYMALKRPGEQAATTRARSCVLLQAAETTFSFSRNKKRQSKSWTARGDKWAELTWRTHSLAANTRKRQQRVIIYPE